VLQQTLFNIPVPGENMARTKPKPKTSGQKAREAFAHGAPSTGTEAQQAIPIATHHFEQRYLFAFAPQAEVLQHVRTQSLKEDQEFLPSILAAWGELQPRVADLLQREVGLADKIHIADVPDAHNARLAAFAADPLFQKTFQTLPSTFALVEVDKLIAPQRTVNLDYVKRLSKSFPQAPTAQELLEICVAPTRSMDPIQHLELGPNMHVFSSPNSDIRLLGSFLKKLTPEDSQYALMGGLPAAAIITFVGYGGSPINVLHAGSRVVLNNGFHRVFALRSLGVKEIPVVMQEVRNVQLEFPQVVAGLPREYLLGAPRPVMMKDYFEPDFAITLRVQERIRLVTLGLSSSQHDVPV
jgi:hypothetical protein